jgi:hypothetical protein
MKAGRVRTLRGILTATGAPAVARRNLVVADGLINYGLKINKLSVWAVDPANSFVAILSYDTIASGSTMDASDNRQFAWSVGNGTGDLNPAYIDPDHIINRDMFLSLSDADAGDYNYLIECQAYALDDNEAIISIIKETSQS